MSIISRKLKVLSISVRCLSTSANTNEVKVKIPELGDVQGTIGETAWTKRKIYQFLGIRYGEAPVGNLRFKAPVPAKPWEGTFDATRYGKPGVMLKNIKNIPDEKLDETYEDCLNLCVYTNGVEKKKPVMVYVHGGAFFDGCAAEYPPNYLLEKDIVLVVPQYRLGPLGFLSTMTEEIPGNAAALDVVLALEWVQKHISNFGGDPNNVTIVGQSAGAGILSCIIYSPAVRQTLFHKAILQSGSAFAPWVCNYSAEKSAREIVGFAGFDNKVPLAELNKSLMNMDIKSLYKGLSKHIITGTIRGIDTLGGVRMTIGGPSNFLPQPPQVLMSQGGGRKDLPMMVGCVKHDGTFALADMYDILMATKIGTANKKFNTMKMIEHMIRTYGIDDFTGSIGTLATKCFWTDDEINSGIFEEMIDGFVDLVNLTLIKAPVFKMAKAHKYLNNNTFLYSFDYKGKHTRFGYGKDTSYYPFDGGVHHSDENIYLFPYPHKDLNEQDKIIAQRMVELWTSFATNGAPKANDVESWPNMEQFNGPYLSIDHQTKVKEDFMQEFNVCSRDKMALQKRESVYGSI